MSTTPAPSKIDALPVAGELLAASFGSYSAADQAFFRFWYGHMLDDLMQPPLSGTSHSTARYIWDAALAPTTPVPAGYALVPIRMTREMSDVTDEEGWQWEDVLAAAGSITPEQYDDASRAATPAQQTQSDAEAWTALGYLSGLHPCMTIDCDQPMAMAEAIFSSVQAEIKQWKDKAIEARAMLESFHRNPATPSAAASIKPDVQGEAK